MHHFLQNWKGAASTASATATAQSTPARNNVQIDVDILDFGPELLACLTMNVTSQHLKGAARVPAGGAGAAGASAGTVGGASSTTSLAVIAEAVPLDVVIILDQSGSMGSFVQKTLQELRASLLHLGLPEEHTVQLIAFHTSAKLIPTTVDALDKLNLRATGTTNMASAVGSLNFWLTTHRQEEDKTTDIMLIVVSDGMIDDRAATRSAFASTRAALAGYGGQVYVTSIRLKTDPHGNPDTEALAMFNTLATGTASNMVTLTPSIHQSYMSDIIVAITESLPEGMRKLTTASFAVNVTDTTDSLRRLPTDKPRASLQFAAYRGMSSQAYFLVKSSSNIAALRFNGRPLGAFTAKTNWTEADFSAFLAFAETQARMWAVAGGEGDLANVRSMAAWCQQLSAIAKSRITATALTAGDASISTRERAMAFVKTLRLATGTLLSEMGQMANAEKLQALSRMNADQKATFVRGAVTSTSLAKRSAKYSDLTADGGVNAQVLKAAQTLDAALSTLRTDEPRDAAVSFVSLDTYRSALLDALDVLRPVINGKHADGLVAADVLKVLGGLGLGFRGTAGNFVDPWTFRVRKVYLGMYVSEQDVRNATVLHDAHAGPPATAADIVDMTGDDDDDDVSAKKAVVGATASTVGAAGADAAASAVYVDPLTHNTYLKYPGEADGLITGVLPLQALDPAVHKLYSTTCIATLHASISCRSVLAPVPDDVMATTAAVLLNLVNEVGPVRDPTSVELQAICMVRNQLATLMAGEIAATPTHPLDAIAKDMCEREDPTAYFTGNRGVADVLRVYATLLASPGCATLRAMQLAPPAPGAGIAVNALQKVLGACAWLSTYKQARKYFRRSDTPAYTGAGAGAVAGSHADATFTPEDVSRDQFVKDLLGWTVEDDAAQHVGDVNTPDIPYTAQTPADVLRHVTHAKQMLAKQRLSPDDDVHARNVRQVSWVPSWREVLSVARFARYFTTYDDDEDAYLPCVTTNAAFGHDAEAPVLLVEDPLYAADMHASQVIMLALVLRAAQCPDEDSWVDKHVRVATTPKLYDVQACAAYIVSVIEGLGKASYDLCLQKKHATEAAIRTREAREAMLTTRDMAVFITLLNDSITTRSAPGYTELETSLLELASETAPASTIVLKKLIVLVTGRWRAVQSVGTPAALVPVWCAGNMHQSHALCQRLKRHLDDSDPAGDKWADVLPLFNNRLPHTYRAERNRHGHNADFPSYVGLGYVNANVMKRDAPEEWEIYRTKHINCCTRGADVVAAR